MKDPCPRCGEENADFEACPRCGLARVHRGNVTPGALPPELAAEWDLVVAKWEEPGPHALFIEHCAMAGVLHLAAAKYRTVVADESRRERAQKSLDRVVSLAAAALARDATPRSRIARNRRIALVIAAVVFVAALVATAAALVSR